MTRAVSEQQLKKLVSVIRTVREAKHGTANAEARSQHAKKHAAANAEDAGA